MRKFLVGLAVIAGVLAVVTVTSWRYGELPEPVSSVVTPVLNPLGGIGNFETERTDGRYYTIIDNRSRVLMETALPVYVGDEYIAEDNKQYRVNQMNGDTAQAELIGYADIALTPEEEAAVVAAMAQPAQATQGQKKVGIYFTHDDESYVPSDGQASVKGKGGIRDVAAQLEKALQAKGLEAELSTDSHAPHDANAYHRSRRTATELMRNGKAQLLIDVHRDSVPAKSYQANVGGQDVTKVKLVVGRQNPRHSANLNFAKKVKAVMDKTHPGLSKGIFIGRGSYNQDLTPSALLIEVGADKNTKEQAISGVTMFADVIPQVMGVAAGAAGTTGGGTRNPLSRVTDTGGSGQALAWILGLLVVGFGAFLLMSSKGLGDAMSKIRQVGGRSWANLLGRVRVYSQDRKSKDRSKK